MLFLFEVGKAWHSLGNLVKELTWQNLVKKLCGVKKTKEVFLPFLCVWNHSG